MECYPLCEKKENTSEQAFLLLVIRKIFRWKAEALESISRVPALKHNSRSDKGKRALPMEKLVEIQATTVCSAGDQKCDL